LFQGESPRAKLQRYRKLLYRRNKTICR